MESASTLFRSLSRSAPIGPDRALRGWRVILLMTALMSCCASAVAADSKNCISTQAARSSENLANIEIASIKLRQLAILAVKGDIASLYDMKHTASLIEREIVALGSPRGDEGPPWTPPSEWISLQGQVKHVDDAAGAIVQYDNLASNVKSQFPILQSTLISLATETAATKKDATRVLNLMKTVSVLYSMSDQITYFMSHGEDAEKTGSSLSRRMAYFEATVSALRDGKKELGIEAETDADMRAQFDEVQVLTKSTFSDLKTLIEGAQTMKKFSESTVRVADMAAALATSARKARTGSGD